MRNGGNHNGKEEVLKYIDSINAKHTEEQEQASSEISDLSSQVTDLKIKTEEGEKSFNELMNAYNEMREHYMMLKTRNDNLESENAKLKTRCEIAEKELCIEKELNKQLEDKLEQERQKSVKSAGRRQTHCCSRCGNGRFCKSYAERGKKQCSKYDKRCSGFCRKHKYRN